MSVEARRSRRRSCPCSTRSRSSSASSSASASSRRRASSPATTGNEWLFIGAWVAGGLATHHRRALLRRARRDVSGRRRRIQFSGARMGSSHRRPIRMGARHGHPDRRDRARRIRLRRLRHGASAARDVQSGDLRRAVRDRADGGERHRHAARHQNVQKILETCTVLGIIVVIIVGFSASGEAAKPAPSGMGGALGLAMVLVLLSYGGWNEIAYLSGEMRDVRRDMVRAIVIGTAVVTAFSTSASISRC